MKKEIEKIKKAVTVVKGKGDPIAAAGPTEGGKSTVMEALASHPDVQELLAIREASGKGSTSETSIIATDYSEIPKDKLIVTAKLRSLTIADCNDDNELLGNILYAAAKDYHKSSNKDLYKQKMEKTLRDSLSQPSNDSLAYKIKDINENDFYDLLEIFKSFQLSNVMIVYNEMLVSNTKKGQKGLHIFTTLLSNNKEFTEPITRFWNFIVKMINQDLGQLKVQLSDYGADFTSSENQEFMVILGQDDAESEIVKTLLKSENGSKEYLLSDISLIFRGDDHLFNCDDKGLLTVAEIGETKIRCIRFIDTQGLFHATGAMVKDESERIIDILSTHHCNKLMLVVNSRITDTVKDSYEAVRMMLLEANRDIEVYILYTHWDEYLKGYSQHLEQKSNTSRFARGTKAVNWDEKYAEACKDQNSLSDSFKECVASNSSKKKPKIIGSYRAAILLDPDNQMENILAHNEVMYPEALQNMIRDFLKEQEKNGSKYRVLGDIENCFSIDTSSFKKQNIKSLYDNLIKGKALKLYASTVRACVRKWCNAGTIHKANVAANDYGYKEIQTYFVQEIRNYTMTFIDNVEISADQYIVDSSDIKNFTDELKDYFNTNQNIGRIVAEMIGKEAYHKGFEKETSFRYQYERFWDMLAYTQNNYFMASNIIFTDNFESRLRDAIKQCISIFVDAKCIVVY